MFIAISFDVLQTGSTALHFAAQNGHLKTVKFLLIVGATDYHDKVNTVEPLNKGRLRTEGLVPYS